MDSPEPVKRSRAGCGACWRLSTATAGTDWPCWAPAHCCCFPCSPGMPAGRLSAMTARDSPQGQLWRLLTGHFVHLGLEHAALNCLGLVLMWALFARDYTPATVAAHRARGDLRHRCRAMDARFDNRLVCRFLGCPARGHGGGDACPCAAAGPGWMGPGGLSGREARLRAVERAAPVCRRVASSWSTPTSMERSGEPPWPAGSGRRRRHSRSCRGDLAYPRSIR